jgi:hypothetical protein
VKRPDLLLRAAILLLAAGRLSAQGDPIAWLNSARQSARVPAVAADSLLSDTAARWAQRLSATGVLSHRGDDGSTGLDRYRAMGGSEVRVGEILGAGADLDRIENAWMKSPDHRRLALVAEWTHAGWGSARAGSSLVVVMMFTQKLVEGLSVTRDNEGLSVSGLFTSRSAGGAVLFNGLDELPPAEWNAATRAFRFEVAAPILEGYLRLGYRAADGSFTLTNAFTLPPGTGSQAGTGRFSAPAASPEPAQSGR